MYLYVLKCYMFKCNCLSCTGCLLWIQRRCKHVQSEVWGQSGDVGEQWLDRYPGSLRMVSVVLQVGKQNLRNNIKDLFYFK